MHIEHLHSEVVRLRRELDAAIQRYAVARIAEEQLPKPEPRRFKTWLQRAPRKYRDHSGLEARMRTAINGCEKSYSQLVQELQAPAGEVRYVANRLIGVLKEYESTGWGKIKKREFIDRIPI